MLSDWGSAKTTGLPLGVRLILLFTALGLMLIALIAAYWLVVFEPSLIEHEESNAHAYAQAQAPLIEKALGSAGSLKQLHAELRTTLSAILLFKEQTSQEAFIQRLELSFDYELIDAPPGSLDLVVGSSSCPTCFVTDTALYHPHTHLLVGVATFYSNPNFVSRQVLKLRITLIWVGALMAALISLAGLWVYRLLRRLVESETNLRTVFEAAPIPMMLQRQDDESPRQVNQAARDYLSLSRELDGTWYSPHWRLLRQTTLRDNAFIGREIQVPIAKNTQRWALASSVPLHFSGAASRLVLLADISELKAMQSELRTASVTDSLTRLYNRHYLYLRLVKEIDLYQRYGVRFSIILFDLDHFKTINDTYGHHVGDEVLIRVATVLRQCIRTVDVVGRYGGEEFLVILPHSSIEDGRELAERIRVAIRDLNWTHPGLRVTLSGGICEYDGRQVDAVIATADKYLYQAKTAGRDRIIG